MRNEINGDNFLSVSLNISRNLKIRGLQEIYERFKMD